MQIDLLLSAPGANIWYDDKFRKTLESYILFLRNDAGTTQIIPDPGVVYRFTGDYFGLLNVYNVPQYAHWLVMRVNNLTSPADCDDSVTSILIPSFTTVDFIRQSYMSTSTITS